MTQAQRHLDMWKNTELFAKLGRGLAMNFDIPARVQIVHFCYEAGITVKQYNAMMAERSKQAANG
jgi:hypothetical protein